MKLRDKRGIELAISSVILWVLAVVLLVCLLAFLFINWERFSGAVKGYFGSDEQQAYDLCESQCSFMKEYDFCCAGKKIKETSKMCADLPVSCSNINCSRIVCG